MNSDEWILENIPDQNGKLAIVTGSSSGIGFEAARILASKNATVIIAVRDLKKGADACEKILAENKNAKTRLAELDLANLESVRKFAGNFKKDYSCLDLLINNAGVMIPPYSKTTDGFELQFGTNHLGHYALTGLLLEPLIKTKSSRVVNVSSAAHKAGNLNFDDLNWEKRGYSAWRAYGDSKIANLYFTFELDRKLKERKIDLVVTAAHPGYTATELQRNMGIFRFFNNIFAQDISFGALPTLRAATEDGLTGSEYFGPGGLLEMRGLPVRVEPSQLARNQTIARRLWDVSAELTGINFELSQNNREDGD